MRRAGFFESSTFLTDPELLVTTLGIPHDRAVALLAEGWMGLLGKSAPELEQLGLTKRKAAILAAAIEISRRSMIAGIDQRPQITSPADAATLLMVEMGHLDQEHLRTVLLDTKNRVMAMPTIYIGSVNTAAIRVGEVFKEAIRRNATALIVVHNHPSGDPTPSPEDILVTRQIVEAGKLLDCDVLDHLVIGRGRYTSMRERGLGFAK
ncbi:RadC family protein [Oscillochloris sp. ZM17-4]|uniref:JAB domain-containing protein n=1 Tax=Oscillochloris sp. ZM17-4 TaxID=2866714 RepID=UPI00351D01E0